MQRPSVRDVDARSGSAEKSAGLAVVPGAREDALVARVRDGDASAFEEVFRAHSATMFAYACRVMGSADDAEDIVQSVFRLLWERRTTWRPTVSVNVYLIGAVRNAMANVSRHASVVRRTEARVQAEGHVPGMSAPAMPVESQVEAAELAAQIEAAAASLAPKCRAVFLERWRRGLTVPETARALGLSPKTVEMQWTRALGKIRERVRRFL